uniref:Uncharacterized protein n=1 Tax=Medicago truncatula TaxID=3880 RepID=A2Q4R9_MEDTR|nr:hypothetical protein MtrDRAFT_AC157777g30v2 [Medicago truncatula]
MLVVLGEPLQPGTTSLSYLMNQNLLLHAYTVIKDIYVIQKLMELLTCWPTQKYALKIHKMILHKLLLCFLMGRVVL